MGRPLETYADRKVVTLKQNLPLTQAARVMIEQNVGCIVCSDVRGNVSGILTDRDITTYLARNEHVDNSNIQSAMSADLLLIDEHQTTEEAIQLMHQHGVRRLPIIRKSSKGKIQCIGIITLDDLLAEELISIHDASQIVVSQNVRQRRVKSISKRTISGRESAKHRQFISMIAKYTELEFETAESVTRFLLESIILKLHLSSRRQLIQQLPKTLQEVFIDLPYQAEKEIELEYLISGVKSRTGLVRLNATRLIYSFWRTLYKLIRTSVLKHIEHQLPAELSDILKNDPATLASANHHALSS